MHVRLNRQLLIPSLEQLLKFKLFRRHSMSCLLMAISVPQTALNVLRTSSSYLPTNWNRNTSPSIRSRRHVHRHSEPLLIVECVSWMKFAKRSKKGSSLYRDNSMWGCHELFSQSVVKIHDEPLILYKLAVSRTPEGRYTDASLGCSLSLVTPVYDYGWYGLAVPIHTMIPMIPYHFPILQK